MTLRRYEVVTFICPIFVTGGTEAVHQACLALNEAGQPAQIAYVNEGATIARDGNVLHCHAPPRNICLDAFANSRPVVATRVDLRPDCLVIVPEVFALTFDDFLPATFAVWWLSVDNMFHHNPAMLDPATRDRFFARREFLHLYQSHYARAFLRQMQAAQLFALGDVTSEVFTAEVPRRPNQGRAILFNPAKGAALAERFFQLHPELRPFPITGMSKAEMATVFRANGIYIDFGTLPGKDRIPREAAACGALCFLHNVGAGRDSADFPVPDFFRFDEAEIMSGALGARVRAAQAAPDVFWPQQESFRQGIFWEDASFHDEVARLLGAYRPGVRDPKDTRAAHGLGSATVLAVA